MKVNIAGGYHPRMRGCVMFAGGILVTFLLTGGCRRDSTPDSPPVTEEKPAKSESVGLGQPMKPETLPESSLHQVSNSTGNVENGIRELDKEKAEIIVRFISNIEARGLRVAVVNKSTGGSALLSIGKEFAGYRLVGCEENKNMAIFLWNGEKIGVGVTVAPPPIPPTAIGPGGTEARGKNTLAEVPSDQLTRYDAWLRERNQLPGDAAEPVPPGGP